ncbi:CoA transferase [Arthrobacter sp. zg-ZUI100]|uniref:CaiB/BaiF CoA transferase family protein n=1 Tax=Arthrobacter jiangjiafuii TaxID=2817475 RepID=UPI001AEEA6AF|nr:CoA transferase [Arthrobacter jiangjiafuii]MBP3037478.1 CoA transferase [Arthrobacter jiangjiafuii]
MEATEQLTDGLGSLQGVTVIEIGTSVAAPFATQIMADLGATVIKVERFGTGDDSRTWAPPSWEGLSVTFLSLNRGKQSMVLNYKEPRGAEILWDMIRQADVLVQNLRPGAMAKAGFTAEALKEANPELIYCEMTGFGGTGPMAGRPAYDPLVQAYGGIVSVTGDDGGAPARVPVSVLDMGTGMWTALSVLEALRRKEKTGKGCHIELSLLQTALMWMSPQLLAVKAGNPKQRRLGSGFGGVVPYGAFPAADDGYIFMSAGNNDTWNRLLDALEVSADAEIRFYTDNADRVEARNQVVELLSNVTARYSVPELEIRLRAAGVPHSPVNDVPQVLADDQVIALKQIVPMAHPEVSDFSVVNLPMTFDGKYPMQQPTAPPALGAGTRSVLQTLGLDADAIDYLVNAGVVGEPLDTPSPSYEEQQV